MITNIKNDIYNKNNFLKYFSLASIVIDNKNSSSLKSLASVNPVDLKLNIRQTAKRWAERFQVNSDILQRLILMESSGNPGITSSTGYLGLMQVSRSIMAKYGGAWNNPDDNIRAGLSNIKDVVLPNMVKVLNIPQEQVPAIAIYLGHQQGATGGPAIMAAALRNDPRSAAVVIQEAVTKVRKRTMPLSEAVNNLKNNLPKEYKSMASTLTSNQFVDIWQSKMGVSLTETYLSTGQTQATLK